MSVLVYVCYTSPTIKMDVYNMVGRCSTMGEKIESLETMGLIKIYKIARTNTNVIAITDKG